MKQPVASILFPAIWPLGTTAPMARPPWATLILLFIYLASTIAMAIFPDWVFGALALGENPRAYQYLTCWLVPSCLLTGLLDMIFLWTLAPTLEGRLGPWKLAVLFAACGVLGAAAHRAVPTPAHETLAGAGALFMGLTGAMVVMFRQESVRIFVGVFFLITPVFARTLRVPILLYAVIYALLQYLLHDLEGWGGDLPVLLDRTGFSPAALLGGIAAGAAVAGILNPPAVSNGASPVARPASDTDGAESALFDELAPAPPIPEALPPGEAPELKADSGNLEALFGNPEDSDVLAAVPKLESAPKPQAQVAEAVREDTGAPIDLGEIDSAIVPASEPPIRRDEPAFSEPEPVLTPALGAKACMVDESAANGGLAEAPKRASGDVEYLMAGGMPPKAPRSENQEVEYIILPKDPEPMPQPKNSEPDRQEIQDPTPQAAAQPAADEEEAIELHLEPSEETRAQAEALKDDTAWPDVQAGRYSVILAPGRPRRIASVVTMLANLHGLSLKGAYQALRHRHGILSENVPREEAERIADLFARAGHAVLIVALTSRINFGGGLDLISIQEHGEHVLFTTVAQMIRAEWSQIVFLAGGLVTITPGTPPRVVLDIFLVKPRHHLRLWDNTFSYSKDMPKFRTQVKRITEKAAGAIHTRSLDKWLRDENETLHPFGSMIEYENYVRWHLMAHLTPNKLVK